MKTAVGILTLALLALPAFAQTDGPCYTVTSTDDQGAGTLRAAILAVNADRLCASSRCRIEFAITAAVPGAWHTIAPLTPLPAIVAPDVEIDATTQSDSNSLGPDVELLGTKLANGNGLDIRALRMAVRGLAIGGFPDNGIFYLPSAVDESRFTIERNFIGVDPTGMRAVMNGSRGIVVGAGVVIDSVIRDNVISGNFRSGLFVTTLYSLSRPFDPTLAITHNRIGVAATTEAPVPNGASGIFFGPTANLMLVSDNVIAHNAQFGVAVSRSAFNIVFGPNRMLANALPGIDYGLDGPTGEFDRGRGDVATLESANYDPATGITTITGRGPFSLCCYLIRYTLYANSTVDGDGYAEGEDYLGTVQGDISGGDRTWPFTLQVKTDLRGKYISAVLSKGLDDVRYESFEFSRPIRVEERRAAVRLGPSW